MKGALQKFLLGAGLVGCLLTTTGCLPLLLGAAAGAGGYAWANGDMEKEFNVSAEKLQRATLRALKDLKVSVLEEKMDRLTAKFIAQFAEGEKVTITINALTERKAKLNIRVGMFGNEAKSEMILSAVVVLPVKQGNF